MRKLALCAGMLAASPARADGREVSLRLAPGTPPTIEATLVHAPRVPLDQIRLSVGGISVPASRIRSYAQGDEPIAVVVVVQARHTYEECECRACEPSVAARLEIQRKFDEWRLRELAPPRSLAAIVSYSTGARIEHGMGPLAAMTGSSVAKATEAPWNVASDMIDGIALGLDQLRAATAPRKALIVIGDANDTTIGPPSTRRLELLKQRAARENVQTFGIIHRSEVSNMESTEISTMIPPAKTINSPEGLASELDAIAKHLTDRYYVSFPITGLRWEGPSIELVVHLGATALDPVTMSVPVAPASGSGRGIAAAIGAIACLFALALVTRHRA